MRRARTPGHFRILSARLWFRPARKRHHGDGRGVIRFVGIICLTLILFTTHAYGCSYAQSLRLFGDNYGVYSDSVSESVLESRGHVSIIRPKVIETTLQKAGLTFEPDQMRFINELELEEIELLHGKSVQSAKMSAPVYDEKTRSIEKSRAASKKGFDYWDRFSLYRPIIDDYFDMTSCGAIHHTVLDSDNYYLRMGYRFNDHGTVQFFEPITDLDDPLIDSWRRIIHERSNSKLQMTPKQFFSNMDGYSHIAIRDCVQGDSKSEIVSSFSQQFEELTGIHSFRDMGHFNMPFEDIALINLYMDENLLGSWSRRGEDKEQEKCQAGTEYLVVRRANIPEPGDPKPEWPFHRDAKDRFLKVENGYVDLRNVQSSILISGRPLIPAIDVKRWIREANSDG